MFLVVLVDLMGFGIVLPLLPFYASKFEASALTIGLLYSVYSLSQLVCSPFWGGLSDRVGRRPIMILSTLGASAAYLLFALSNSLVILFASRILAGIMGGNISTAQAYVADVTTHEDRAKGMGLIGAAFGIGFVLGPALSTLLIHPATHTWIQNHDIWGSSVWLAQNQYALPGLAAAALSFLSFLLVLTKLPETISVGQKNDVERVQKSSIFSGSFWSFLKEKKGTLLPLLLLSVFVLSLCQSSLYSAFPLFCKKNLGLTAEKVGMQFVWMGLIAVLIQGGLIRVLLKRFSEKKLFLAGNFIMFAGFVLIPFATSEHGLTAALCLMGVGGSLNGPTLTSLVSKESDPNNLGKTLGTSQGISALGRVIGPAWGGALFALTPQLPFLATAVILSVAIRTGFKIRKN